MDFPEGQIKAKCPTQGCGANWELGPEGFWSITPIAPITVEQQLSEAWKKLIGAMAEAAKKVYNAIMDAVDDINPKWLNYYRRTKKQRIQNKYWKRILTCIMNSLQTAPHRGSRRRRT